MPVALVTVPTDGSGTLLALLRGTAGATNNAVPNQSPAVRMLTLKAMPSNEGVISLVPVGTTAVSGGMMFQAGETWFDHCSHLNDICLTDKALIADRPNQLVSIVWGNA